MPSALKILSFLLPSTLCSSSTATLANNIFVIPFIFSSGVTAKKTSYIASVTWTNPIHTFILESYPLLTTGGSLPKSYSALKRWSNGEHHSKKYLPLQQFKAQQAKNKAQLFANDLHLADISYKKIEEADQAAHFPSKGFIFTSEDKDNIELPTKHYLYLKESSVESSKMKATIHVLQDDNRQLKHDEYQARYCSLLCHS